METSARIIFDDERPSDSPFVERVWRSHSERGGKFIAVASNHWELVVARVRGEVAVVLHGGETRARAVDCPADGEWFAIRFTADAFMPETPPGELLNGRDVFLPVRSQRRFLLDNRWWEIPAYDNAEVFVRRLAAAGLVDRDTALAGAAPRTAQRHMRRRFGVTQAFTRQVERARSAALLLRAGHSIADVVVTAGYYDQAHLTRSLRELIGLTPATIARAEHQLSFLYKTERDSDA